MEELEKIKQEFVNDAATVRYRIRDEESGKYLDILNYNEEKDSHFFTTLYLSKDGKMLILDNGALSLNTTFLVGPIEKRSIHINGTNQQSLNQTNYTDIYIFSGQTARLIASYSFDNDFFIKNMNKLESAYQGVCIAFTKIFHDAAGNFDCPDVRASESECKILDELVAESQE